MLKNIKGKKRLAVTLGWAVALKNSAAGSLISCSKQVTNAWSLWRRVVPHAVLWWNVCRPCAVPWLSIAFSMNPSLPECWGWCLLSPVSRWLQDRRLHSTSHPKVDSWSEVIAWQQAGRRTWADSLKGNRIKGGTGWGWRGRTWLSHDKMHKAPTGCLPAPVLCSWREPYKLSHTLNECSFIQASCKFLAWVWIIFWGLF